MMENINSFFCPLTLNIMVDPVVDKEGHTYERCEITAYLNKCAADRRPLISPMTRNPIKLSDLQPNIALKNAIEEVGRHLNDSNCWKNRDNLFPQRATNAAAAASKVLSTEMFEVLDAFIEMDLVNTL